MRKDSVLNIHIDGAARGNPGPAAYGFVILRAGEPPVEGKDRIGSTTNNVAEYTALVRALEQALPLAAQAQRVHIHSDSELLVKQMKGEYKVKNERLRILHEQAKKLWSRFPEITIRHVPREQNTWADRLCNEALDGCLQHDDDAAEDSDAETRLRVATSSSVSAATRRRDALEEEALACLQTAARIWAHGDAGLPPPEAVWDQLWSILEEHGAVRQKRS